MWAWSALIAVLGLLNLWHWITGIGGGSFGMTGAIGVATAFACLIGRMVYLVRRNRPNR
jgi:hypothetical protein